MGRDRSLTSEVSKLDVSNKANYEYQILNLTTDTTFQKSKPDDCSIFDTRQVCIPTFSSWNEYTQIEKISDDTQVEGTLYSFQINPRRTCDYCGSVKMTYHFTQQGLLTYSTMDYVSQFLSYTYKTIFTLNTGIPVTALSSGDYITKEQFVLANNQVIAKSKLSSQATSITNKAKLFAKRAKQALSSTHLIQAAKGLKIRYVSSGKGIKITQKYLNATLSSCLSVVNKNVQVKPCS